LSNAGIASLLEQKRIVVGFSEGAPDWSFPVIDNNRLVEEFGGAQSSLANEFEYLFDCFINHDNGIEDERIT
jgi:hypothetical protein